MKTEFLYGIHPVREALKAGRRNCLEIFVSTDRSSSRHTETRAAADALNIPIQTITSSQISALAGSDAHQGIGAKVSSYPLVDMETLIEPRTSCFLLLLDSIQDPQNMGALIRTALCAGVTGILFPRDRSSSPLPSVSKASAGAMEHVKMAMITNLSTALQFLKHSGVWIAGLEKSALQTVYDMEWTGPVGIVIGGEEKGIRPLVRKQCDFLVSIPQAADFNSLNASAAGAVVMYEVLRQRRNT